MSDKKKIEGDFRCRLPLVYEGGRRVGKTKKLVEMYQVALNHGKDAYIVVMSFAMKEILIEKYPEIDEKRIAHTKDQIEKSAGFDREKRKHFLVDEWWLQKSNVIRELTWRSWMGDEVVGFGTFDEKLVIKSFDQHFETNPDLTHEHINEYLSYLLG